MHSWVYSFQLQDIYTIVADWDYSRTHRYSNMRIRAPKPLPRVRRLENPYESISPEEYYQLHTSMSHRAERTHIQDNEIQTVWP